MKSLKALILGLSFTMVLTSSVSYAATSNMTHPEMSTLATVAAIDQTEILLGAIATNKTNNTDVVNFANMMISQHSANLTQILGMPANSHELLKALSTGTAKKFMQQANQDMTTLGALQGNEFINAYVNAMVTGHEGALNLIDHTLMKTASSATMKNFLVATRAVVVQHLEHAKALQKQLHS